ncbi:MAG: ATP-binding protein, partial [Actinomycetota bacterium]
MPTEKIRLRIGDLAKAVLVTGQAYQDPKDALNEFVSNAADEYSEAGLRGGQIRIMLRRRGRYPMLAIEDSGRGMDAARLRAIAGSLFDSTKAGDSRTLGEKAIGILAFQQLGERCDIITCPRGSRTTLALRLERGRATAELVSNERRRARSQPGTTVYIHGLDPDVLRVLTLNKVVNYLRRRRAVALARGDYAIEVTEGRRPVMVTPEAPDGVRLELPARHSRLGKIEFFLYVSPRPDKKRRVAVVGAGGTTIIDDLSELDEFASEPWDSDQVSGRIAFDALRQTAGRRALLRDRDAFPLLVGAAEIVEPVVVKTLEQVARDVGEETADRLADAVRKIFSRVLRELSDIDNPMRTAVGSESGNGALLEDAGAVDGPSQARDPDEEPPAFGGEVPDPPPPVEPEAHSTALPGRTTRPLPDIAPDPDPDGYRSRFDADQSIVYYNDRHPDYLLVKKD